MITEVAIEVMSEISAALVIVGVIAYICITFTKPEEDIEWKDIDGAK